MLLRNHGKRTKTYEEAITSQNRRKWITAMNEEIESMKKLETWELVELPEDRKAVDCKWVYKLKIDPVNNTKRYRARLVARGFSQKYGQDYDEIFAPVVRQATIKIGRASCRE